MLPAPRHDLDATPRRRPVAVLAAPAVAAGLTALAALLLLVACAGRPAASAPPAPTVAARPAAPVTPASSPGLPPAPPSPTDAPSAAAEPPPADGAPGLGIGLGGGGVAWGCGIGIDGTCGFHLFLARHNKVEASEECLAWRRRALQQQHAPAGLASIERVRVGSGMDEPAVRAALEPTVRQALGCYEEALRVRPTLRGRLAARLTLDARAASPMQSMPAPRWRTQALSAARCTASSARLCPHPLPRPPRPPRSRLPSRSRRTRRAIRLRSSDSQHRPSYPRPRHPGAVGCWVRRSPGRVKKSVSGA